jgi:hypothetical protein
MRPRFLFTAMMLVLGFALSTAADDDKKDQDEKANSDSEASKISAKQLTGKLTKISSKTSSFTLRVEYLDLKPNAGYRGNSAAGRELQHLAKQQNELARLQAQIMTTRNPAKRAAKLQQVAVKLQRQELRANAQHLPYQVVTRHQDIPLIATEDVKVRVAKPPVEFDDNGNPKKYTPEQLRKLKGPEKLWGYPGDWSNLQKGQEVRVFFARHKKTKTEEDDKANEAKTAEVALICILTDTKKQ